MKNYFLILCKIPYDEHPYPEGVVSYSKTNPIDIQEFEPIRKWWNKRKESSLSWKVNIEKVIENADKKADVHRQNSAKASKKANSLKEKIRQNKESIKTEKDKKKQESLQSKISELEKELTETETYSRLESQTATSIYYSAFDLDYKNPHRAEEESHDPQVLLKNLLSIETKIGNLQNDIKDELKLAMEK